MVEAIVHHTDTRVGIAPRMNWGAIWAGFIVATVVQIVLSVLGTALGFSIWNPTSGGFGGFALGAWLWFVGTAIVSLFLGGLVMGRFAGILTRGSAFIHGTVLWGLSAMLAAWLITNGLGMLVGSTLNVVAQTSGAAVNGAFAATGALANGAVRNPGAIAALRDSVNKLRDSLQASGKLPSAGAINESAGEVVQKAAGGTAAVAWFALITIALSLGAATWGAEITTKRLERQPLPSGRA